MTASAPSLWQLARMPAEPMAAAVAGTLSAVAYGPLWEGYGPDRWDETGCRACGRKHGFWPHYDRCPVTVATDALIAAGMH